MKRSVLESSQLDTSYYSLDAILRKKADYNIIFGERSNGKTYAALEYGLRRFAENGEQFAYVRRWQEDLRGKRAETLFNAHVQNGLISELTDGEYTDVFYMGKKWFLSKWDEEKKKRIPYPKPFCYGFCLSEVEHDKSTSYPEITTVVFDEFLTRKYYLPDEFVIFMNTLSTIIRQRDNVKIFMLGNTVNKFCPYFGEMGLKHVAQQEQGTIDLYKHGPNGARIAVEYAASVAHNKPSNKYFCFDNENLQMITGGKWELASYPHLDGIKYAPKDVIFNYYIVFQENIVRCDIVCIRDTLFTYAYEWDNDIPNPNTDMVYSLESVPRPNYYRKLLSTASPAERAVSRFYVTDKIFFQSNEVGEMVRNYLMNSVKSNLTTV